MGAFVDLTGEKFQFLTALKISEKGKRGSKIKWLCKCDCGNEIVRCSSLLKRVKNNHCGCQHLVNRTTKVCAMCKEDKPKENYHDKTVDGKSSFQSKCKKCTSEYVSMLYRKNRKKILERQTYLRHQAERKEKTKKYYLKNKEKYKERYLKYMSVEEKRLKKSQVAREYNKKNKEKIQERVKRYNQKDHVKKRGKETHAVRKQTDPIYNIKRRLRFRLRHIIAAMGNPNAKYKSAVTLIGCDIEFFKSYIESKFTEGMSWERFSEIHIDHKKPCAKFDLSKLEEQKKCFHYTNLQPLWSADNLSKNDKYFGD